MDLGAVWQHLSMLHWLPREQCIHEEASNDPIIETAPGCYILVDWAPSRTWRVLFIAGGGGILMPLCQEGIYK